MTKKMELREYVRKHFPMQCGVYLMKDAGGRIRYVGKATALRTRVLSYFRGEEAKVVALMNAVVQIEYVITNTTFEALLLECNLIKQWHPKYNIDLKDGKSYPVVRVTNEKYPRIFRTRTMVKDGSVYFGPYINTTNLHSLLEEILRLYPLRKCRGAVRERARPCLHYHIGRCAAPCANKISHRDYMERVQKISAILEGKTADITTYLHNNIKKAIEQQRFEKAGSFRDALLAIKMLKEEQHIIDFDTHSVDYFGYTKRGQDAVITIFKTREGKVIATENYHLQNVIALDEQVAQVIIQYYERAHYIPQRLVVSHPQLAQELNEYFGHYVREGAGGAGGGAVGAGSGTDSVGGAGGAVSGTGDSTGADGTDSAGSGTGSAAVGGTDGAGGGTAGGTDGAGDTHGSIGGARRLAGSTDGVGNSTGSAVGGTGGAGGGTAGGTDGAGDTHGSIGGARRLAGSTDGAGGSAVGSNDIANSVMPDDTGDSNAAASVTHRTPVTSSAPVSGSKKQRRESSTTPVLQVHQVENPKEKMLMGLVLKNAEAALVTASTTHAFTEALEELQKILGLAQLPEYIEGFDIAHVGGRHTVASMVAFQNGKMVKERYRRYRIRSLQGKIDDFEAMREVTARRYSRVLNENAALPQLIVVDGGLGQVHAVWGVLRALGLVRDNASSTADTPHTPADIGKAPKKPAQTQESARTQESAQTQEQEQESTYAHAPRTHGQPFLIGIAKQNEEIYLPHRSDPLILPRRSVALRLLQSIRDEAHRFATNYRAAEQKKEVQHTTLRSIPGIGPQREAALYHRYDSLADMAAAAIPEFASVLKMSVARATAAQAALRALVSSAK